MQPDDIFKKFILTFDIWLKSLNHYSTYQLQKKPDNQSWSIGQVYMHLIDQTINFNIPQIEICISNNDNAEKVKSVEGEEVFRQNSLPPIRLKSPAQAPPQPENVEEVLEGFYKVRESLSVLTRKISITKFKGKTMHPGFHYLNAGKWLQFFGIHFRH